METRISPDQNVTSKANFPLDAIENKRRNLSSASQSMWWCVCERVCMTSHLPHCRFQTARGIAIPIPRLGEKAVAGIESPRPTGYASNVEPCGSGFRPPGKALHGCRRLHLGEGAAPSPTEYTGNRCDPADPVRKWWKRRCKFCESARERCSNGIPGRQVGSILNAYVTYGRDCKSCFIALVRAARNGVRPRFPIECTSAPFAINREAI